jgi:putative heme-binding domain-containing protein
MLHMRFMAFAFLPLLLHAQHDAAPPAAVSGKEHGLKDPASIAAGALLYQNSCGGCHGPDGIGGRGPNLVRQLESHGLKDDELFAVIRNGVPGTDMPPTRVSDDDTWKLAAYLRALTAPAADNKTPGDAAAGEALYWSSKAGCSNCHAIHGKGSRMGPDLSNIGGSRPLANIRAALVPPKNDPSRNVALAGKEGVTVTMKSGAVLKGIARNRSNYSMQLVDETGALHMISMAGVKSIAILDRSLMPDDYDKRFSSDELRNLLAYLARQTVREGAAQ